MNPLFILVIGLVAVFFMLILTSSSGYLPYDGSSRNYATYEPMTSESDLDADMDVPDVSESVEQAKPVNKKSSNSYLGQSEDESSIVNENFEPIMEEPRTIRYGPLRDSEVIDKFSQVTSNGIDGVNGCVSSGLSNSGGYICLTPELIQLLKTRGGNATGK